MSTQREVLQQAAPAVLSATQMQALQDARTTAVHWTAKARVPECGEFGRVAQDLDWLVNELAAPQQEVQEPVAWAYQWKQGNPISWYVTVARWPESDIWHEYPLYTTPQQEVQEPLSDERIQDLLGIGDPTEQEKYLIRMGFNAARPPQRHPHRTVTYVCPVCAASLEKQE